MYRTKDKDIWRVFREHHYLSAEMNKASDVYVIYWDNVLVGFRSVLPLPNGTIKYGKRGNRLVVLPDYQNLGFGTHIMEFIGDYYLSKGYKYFMRSTHLRLGRHWASSNLWKFTSHNQQKRKTNEYKLDKFTWAYDVNRIAYSAEYLGHDYANKPHIEIHVDDNPNINYDIMKADLEWLKERYWLCVITGEINTPSKIEDICLELGIRTQLLYTTKKGVATIGSKYKKKKIVTTWDEAFSEKVRNYYK